MVDFSRFYLSQLLFERDLKVRTTLRKHIKNKKTSFWADPEMSNRVLASRTVT